MLIAKMGIAIHVDYSFRVVSKNPAREAGPFLFVDNEITTDGLIRHGKETVFNNAAFGTQSKPEKNVGGVLVPYIKIPMSNLTPKTSIERNDRDKTITVISEIKLKVSSWPGLAGDTLLTLREFGIEDYSRVILKDEFQKLDGLVIGFGDTVEVSLLFRYTYYTNNMIGTVGDDQFGERVEYTSEIIRLGDANLCCNAHNTGYASPNMVELFSITEDIRNRPSELIRFNLEDDLQHEADYLDIRAHRIDTTVIGYFPEAQFIYGFILKDKLRGMGTLIRLLKPIKIEQERRYEVGGYIQWSRTADSLDDGFETIHADIVEEIIPLKVTGNGSVTLPMPSDDIAFELTDLNDFVMALETSGQRLDFQYEKGWDGVRQRLMETGLFESVELLSTRPGLKQPSVYEFTHPSDEKHTMAVKKIADANIAKTPLVYPSLMVGGDYIVEESLSSWRWDCYYPYYGAIANEQWAIYGLMDVTKANEFIKTLPMLILNTEEISEEVIGGSVSEKTTNRTGALIIRDTLTLSGDTQKYMLVNSTLPIDTAVGRSMIATTVSDFDTPRYDDWVEGTTEFTVNAIPLDLRSDVVSDNRRNVTEFNIDIIAPQHRADMVQVVINRVRYGNLENISVEKMAELGIELKITRATPRTTYNFKLPYSTKVSDYVDICFVGNSQYYAVGNLGALLTLVKGSHGYRVYNNMGSEISGVLVPADNPFMCAGVRLFQNVPDYLFKYKNLTLTEARKYMGDPALTGVLPDDAFELSFANSVYNVRFQDILSWRSELLDGRKLYPAIGVDLTRIGNNIADTEILVEDLTGRQWTKKELLSTPTTHSARVIDQVFYFASPFELVEGNQQFVDRLISEFYVQTIEYQGSTIVVITYPLESATISPDPITIIKGSTVQATYTYTPTQAIINKVVWSSNDESIATVDENGVVTAVDVGNTTIRLVLNDGVIATASVIVSDADLVIGCAGSVPETTAMTWTGGQIGLEVNSEMVILSADDATTKRYLRDHSDFRLLNVHHHNKPAPTTVPETPFIQLDGKFDLWVDGALVATDVGEQQIVEILRSNERFEIYDGESIK